MMTSSLRGQTWSGGAAFFTQMSRGWVGAPEYTLPDYFSRVSVRRRDVGGVTGYPEGTLSHSISLERQ